MLMNYRTGEGRRSRFPLKEYSLPGSELTKAGVSCASMDRRH